jgi:glycosyltransferase involved in cell wall biosynthesis
MLAASTLPDKDYQLISIIMPSRNEGNHLKKTIDSLLENTFYPYYEILIMDDASDDGSTAFLNHYPYKEDKRIKLHISETPKGCRNSWISGIESAEGEIYKFLDAHHCFSPYWLTNLFFSLQRRGFEAIIGPVVCKLDPGQWNITNAVTFGWACDPSLSKIFHLQYSEVLPSGMVGWFSGHQITIPRAVYEEIGGFCTLLKHHNTDDFDLCLRAFLFGYNCYVEPTALIGHLYKNELIDPPTWAEAACNYFILLYLNLGKVGFEQYKNQWVESVGYEDGLLLFQGIQKEVEEQRNWIIANSVKTSEDLLVNIRCFVS